MSKILVVAVHPDDETLGCGGTLLKHKQNGDEIYWLICTETEPDTDFYKKRQAEIAEVSHLYGFDGVHYLGLRSMHVDEYAMSDLVSRISAVMNVVKPSTIYLPFKGDVHSDHRKIFEAAYSCTKTFRYPFVKRVLMLEALSETEFAPSLVTDSFIPNVFVDIGEHMDKKRQIMHVFESELGEHPFPRSIKSIDALATYRGSTAGCAYAESFVLLKEIL